MTEHGFEVIPIDSKVFKQQLESLIDVPFSAIKIGLLPNVEIAELTLDFVKNHPGIPIVLDPVLVCKETHDVEVSRLRDELVKFFPYVTVITPNLPEAELLIDKKIHTLDDMKRAACILNKAIDVFYNGKDYKIFEEAVLDKNNTGAGCTFASSIASELVKGYSEIDAVANAKAFVFESIKQSNEFGVVQYAK